MGDPGEGATATLPGHCCLSGNAPCSCSADAASGAPRLLAAANPSMAAAEPDGSSLLVALRRDVAVLMSLLCSGGSACRELVVQLRRQWQQQQEAQASCWITWSGVSGQPGSGKTETHAARHPETPPPLSPPPPCVSPTAAGAKRGACWLSPLLQLRGRPFSSGALGADEAPCAAGVGARSASHEQPLLLVDASGAPCLAASVLSSSKQLAPPPAAPGIAAVAEMSTQAPTGLPAVGSSSSSAPSAGPAGSGSCNGPPAAALSSGAAVHVFVFVHGYQGVALDLFLLRGHLRLLAEQTAGAAAAAGGDVCRLEAMSSRVNEGRTDDSIEDMGARLAEEVWRGVVSG